MTIAVRRLDAGSRSDFWRLHCDAGGHGWCCCVAWWTPTWDGWSERSAAENKALREELFDRGEYDGYLLYQDEAPVAWCQVGRRDRLDKLREQYGLPEDPETWALSCFVVAPAHRGMGLGHHLLVAVLADLRAAGVRRIEAYPARGADLPADDVWTGPEALFVRQGFRQVGGTDRRPVLALDL